METSSHSSGQKMESVGHSPTSGRHVQGSLPICQPTLQAGLKDYGAQHLLILPTYPELCMLMSQL
jgi:hypothetical protein